MLSLVQHRMNGTLVGSSNEPDIDGIVLKHAFIKGGVRNTFGDLQHLNQGADGIESTEINILWTAPLGLW